MSIIKASPKLRLITTKKRFENYKMQPVEFAFMPDFKGKFSQYGINPDPDKALETMAV